MIIQFFSTIFFVLLILLVKIECRQNLRNYVVAHNYVSSLRRDEYSVYDENENQMVCKMESSAEYSFNRLTNLLSYPSYSSIATIRNVYTPFMYQAYLNIFDDELNKWVYGQIIQRYHPFGFLYSIEYGGQNYVMENRRGSSFIDIRRQQRSKMPLSRFYRKTLDRKSRSSKYDVRIYTNDLPDPLHILALYAYDSIYFKNQTKSFSS